MTRPLPIRIGDRVVVTRGPNKGLQGTVLNVYPATEDMSRRAYVEFPLFDGPHRRAYGIDWLDRVK